MRARQPKQGEAVPAPALHPSRASAPLTGDHRATASSGRNRRNRQTKDTTTHQLGLSVRCLFLRKVRSGAKTPRWRERHCQGAGREGSPSLHPRPACPVQRHPRLQCMSTSCRKNHVQADSCPVPAAGSLSGTSPQQPQLPRESGPHSQGKVLFLEQTLHLMQTLSQGEGPLGCEV